MYTLIGLVCILSSATARQQLEAIYEWSVLKYNTPDGYPGNGSFRANETLIASVEVGLDRIFFAVPKFFSDNPASLVYVPKSSGNKSPTFEAYPGWDWHAASAASSAAAPITEQTCGGFISVHRLRADQCGRLWALDSGILYRYDIARTRVVCPPKLVVFDMRTHQVVKQIVIQREVLAVGSMLTNFVIDDTDENGVEPADDCDLGHIYISDQDVPAVIVYSVQTGKMWRHTDATFYPQPEHGALKIAGDTTMHLMCGIIGIALSTPHIPHREFFYTAMASKTIYALSTEALKRRPPVYYLQSLPVRKVAVKPSQSMPLSYNSARNSLVFSPLNETALISWDLEERRYRVLAFDPIVLQWVLEIQPALLDDSNIWVISTRLHKTVIGTLNPHEINQRVLRIKRHST